MRTKVAALESDAVATVDVDALAVADKELQERYGVEGVPMVVVADHEGVVRTALVGPVSAADLWSAVAAARDG
jgi:thiol:disulfide interchange protein